MDRTQWGVEPATSFVPARLLGSPTLGRSSGPPGGLARLAAVLVACAMAGMGGGLFLVRPATGPMVVAQAGHARPEPRIVGGSTIPFRGAGAWIDVWDYAPSYQRAAEEPVVGPADVAAMAASGSRTLYLQTAGVARTVGDTEEPGLLRRFLAAAHASGMRVVGWYAPSLTDPEEDLGRLLAVARFSAGGERFDGLAVDVEVNRGSPQARSELLALSRRLRAAVGPAFPLAIVVPPPATLEAAGSPVPWRPLHHLYDAWVLRLTWETEGADPATVTRTSVGRLRDLTGDRGAAVHPLGGSGGAMTEGEARAFAQAAADSGAVGFSVYDFRSTPAGALIEIATASAGSGDRELSE